MMVHEDMSMGWIGVDVRSPIPIADGSAVVDRSAFSSRFYFPPSI